MPECLGVLPLGDDDFEMLDIVGVSSADELGLTDADFIAVGRTAAIQATQGSIPLLGMWGAAVPLGPAAPRWR